MVTYPVPKVPKPTSPVDYMPISVVPILSRIVERFIVYSYIHPALQSTRLAEDIKDQFAFRPAGSTTAAVIDLLQQTSTMLENNDYVLIISLDFSKAFDRVSHQTLMQKLGAADLPDHIYNWIVHYFSNRGPTTYNLGAMSCLAMINASVIPGSVIGPTSYIIEASDLHPIHRPNALMSGLPPSGSWV